MVVNLVLVAHGPVIVTGQMVELVNASCRPGWNLSCLAALKHAHED